MTTLDKSSTFAVVLRFLSILAGGMSLFTLARVAIDFGLSPVFEQIVWYYQALVYPIIGLLERPLVWLFTQLGWRLPEGWQDVVVLYFIFGGAFFRSMSAIEKSEAQGFGSRRRLGKGGDILKSFLWPIFLLGYLLKSPVIDKLGIENLIRQLQDFSESDDGQWERNEERYKTEVLTWRRSILKILGKEVVYIVLATTAFALFNSAI